jgi:Asp-tRNA(Asn)/Glu-tRNA(Gln) amidotransferase A subunit family amidase
MTLYDASTRTELHYMSAREALARFRDRTLSPVEVLDAVIARAEAVEPVVNALCHRRFEAARAEARAAEARYAGRGEVPRPLEGLPVAIKEEEPIQGQPWTLGSLIYADQVAPHTSEFVRRQLAAGAIVHTRTTTPEFSCAGWTHTRLWGVTRNPYNPELAVGGSSGGSAASLASGTSMLASGSDIGGSIRIPAAACGVVGYKPPYGRVPCDPPYNLDTYCHCGPLARTVADCALYENVVAGFHSGDITTLRDPVTLPETFSGIDGMRIALSFDLGDWPVDEEVRANTAAVADALRAAGAVVEEVDLRLPRDEVMRATAIHFANAFAADIGREVESHPELVNAYVADMVRWARECSAGGDVATGLALEAKLYEPVGALLEAYDALVVPASCVAGLDAGEDYIEATIDAGGVALDFPLENFLTPVFNIMSRCPVLAVPSGIGARNAPTGVQIVGPTYDDLSVFRVGAALEAARPWDRWPETVVAR